MTTHNPDDLPSASVASTLCADDAKRPYQTPCLTFNGKLEKVTLQYTFGTADGVCPPGGQGSDPNQPNFDPDCT